MTTPSALGWNTVKSQCRASWAMSATVCSSDGIHSTGWARSLRGMRTSGPSRIALL
ncbi:hypothetical protein OG594_45470 [Streptomyces sp. NBC_01214]|uniref:hypothetical protein n=1 Tax=Streptomyces sp. NBC_01214 TaxID=2903777 RepID=UPI002252513A|nr:hypothetical protein [Streptomyces sp. NBC_01214]MCX4808731.1 hypothetical protein [Streptomyces sp. NBC_01214]